MKSYLGRPIAVTEYCLRPACRTKLLANTIYLYNICTTSAKRLGRWSNIVQMLYKCSVFAGLDPFTRSRLCFVVGMMNPSGQQKRDSQIIDNKNYLRTEKY